MPPPTIALTVLRSTGMLSRLGMAYRPFPAGPLTPVDGLQMTGRRVTLALRPGRRASTIPTPWPTTSSCPSRWSPAWAAATRPPTGTALSISGAEVSAVRRDGGVLEVRVFNPTP